MPLPAPFNAALAPNRVCGLHRAAPEKEPESPTGGAPAYRACDPQRKSARKIADGVE